MDGVASILPEPFYTRTFELWKSLEKRCQVGQVFITPIPHFSWHVAAEYDSAQLDEALRPLCAATRPLTVRTTGIGIFSQPTPIVYIAIVKDKPLLELHARLYRQLKKINRGASPYYHPDFWMPHITLVFQDLTPENARCVFERLAFEPFTWQFNVDHLSVVRQEEGQPLKELINLRFGGEE